MAQFPRETNIAVKEGLDALFGDGQTSQLFAAPVATQEDLVARGLVDETGTATDRGVLFTQLQDAGLFDERGAMTPKAQAYAMDYAEVVGGGERTLDAYKARMEDGIDNPDVSWDKTLGAVGEYAWDMAAGFGTMVKLVNKEVFAFGESPADLKKREAETSAAMTAGMEGAMKANFELAGMMGVANAHLVNEWFYDAPEQEREKRVWLARQQRDKISYDNQAAKIGETLESFLPVDGVTEQMAADKQTLGKPLFDQTVKQGDAIGQMVTPDMLIPMGFATKAATTGSKISRLALTAERTLGQRAAAATRLAAKELEHASAVRIAGAAEKTAAQAQRTAGSLAGRFEATGDQVLGQGARRAGEIAAEHGAIATRSTAAAAEAAAEVERLTAQAAKLTTLIPEKAAQKFLQTVELGRKVKALPATALGATLEQVGNGLTRGDAAITGFLKERGLDQLYTGAVGAAGIVGLAGNPLVGAVGLGAGVLKTGKLIESYGKLLRYVGKEMTQARGQIPFWQRVAAHTAPGSLNRGIAHTFGAFELGGATADVIRRTGRGVMAAAPADLAFEWLADDGDISANTFKQAFAESLVIGGSFAAAGGAFMGTKSRMRELAVNDELNFRKGLVEPRQKAMFEAIPHESRRAIATYSIANPTLNFNFTDAGASHYDPPTNTATINIASTNPLKALLGHEVLHHTVIKNNMEGGIAALFLGDTKGNTTGGLLRAKDGTLDPNFGEFVETYNRRMDNAGAERPGLDAMAVEYFIEQHSDHYSDMAQSGALGALAARGAARRGLGAMLDTVLPRTPVLKDLHFKMGGIMDGNGAMVTGNGLLGFGGIRQLPASNRMFRDMNRRSSGRVPGQFEPLGTDKPDGGPSITLDPANNIDLGLMHPMIVVDDAGNPVLQGGKPTFIDKATDMLRGAAGITVMERLRENQAAGRKYAPGELRLDDNGEVQGRWLAPDVLRDVIAKHKFNPEQAQVMRSVNAAIKTGDGNRMVVINFPATKKLKNGKTVYAPQAATLRDIVPVGLTITKDGNLLIGLMSVTKLNENIVKRAQDKRGKRLYGGNTDLILQDVRSMMDYHKRGEDSIGHFRDKYGAVEADERKKFINTMFGLLNKSEQAVLNPLLLEDGVTSRDNVYRTYRVDRVSKAVPMAPDQHQPMPFSYEAASAVKMPERMLPEPGTPAHDAAYLEAAKSGDMATAQRMVDQAAKAAGYGDQVLYHNTDAPTKELDGGFSLPAFFTPDSELFSKKGGNKIRVYVDRGKEFRPSTRSEEVPPQLMAQGYGRQSEFDTVTNWAGKVVRIDGKPSQIKSAEAITRDDSGKIIPLSERFNAKTADLRYLPEPLDVPATASGAAVKTKLKHSKKPVSFEAGNGRVESPGLRYLPEPVYHGTPHQVDQFSTDKIGTGEGAQAYGWGLYFAGDKVVAESYRDQLSTPSDSLGHSLLAAGYLDSRGKAIKPVEKIFELIEKVLPKATDSEKLAAIRQASESIRDSGNLYTVKLKPEAHEFLDWDQPLSEQSEFLKQAFKAGAELGDIMSNKAYAAMIKATDAFEDWNGSMLYAEYRKQVMRDNGTLGKGILNDKSDQKASKALAWLGIRGIRYLDGNSRKDGEGSYNYVVFDEKDIEITHANGKPTATPAAERYLPEPLDGGGKNRGMDPAKINTPKETRLMDQALATPREIPKDLREAWDIGNKVSHLSDSEAVHSGMVPDWVFNFGHDINEFYEAGRRGESPEYVVGWRRGGIPERGRSVNWADNNAEPGVSLAYAHNRTDMELNPMTMLGVSHRKKTFVDGWAFPKSRWGSDGEIVTLGTKELKP